MNQEAQADAFQRSLGPLRVHHHFKQVAGNQHSHRAGDEDQCLVELSPLHGPVRQHRSKKDTQRVLQNHMIREEDPVISECVPETFGNNLIRKEAYIVGKAYEFPGPRCSLVKAQAYAVQHRIGHKNHIKQQCRDHIAHPVYSAGLDAFSALKRRYSFAFCLHCAPLSLCLSPFRLTMIPKGLRGRSKSPLFSLSHEEGRTGAACPAG